MKVEAVIADVGATGVSMAPAAMPHFSPKAAAAGGEIQAAAVRDLRLRLLDNGWSPIPAIGKRPFIKGWTRFCRCPATAEEIEGWQTDDAEMTNTGIACGNVIGIDIDIDDADLAHQVAAVAMRVLGHTGLVRYGRRPRRMLVYRLADGAAEITYRRVTGEAGAAVEVLSHGKQFIGFGEHPDTGERYEWVDDSPLDISVDHLPPITPDHVAQFVADVGKLIGAGPQSDPVRPSAGLGAIESAGNAYLRFARETAASDYAGYAEAALADEAATVRHTLPGNQQNQLNTSAFKIGQLVGAGVLDRDRAERELRQAAAGWQNGVNQKPWTNAEVAKIVSRGLDDGMREPRELPAPGNAHAGGEANDNVAPNNQVPAPALSPATGWPDPTLFRKTYPAPAFPIEALPTAVAGYCWDEAERMQAPVDLLGTTALVTLAGLIGKGAAMRPKRLDNWQERPCFWGMIIQPPGSMKTAALNSVTTPLRRIQVRIDERHALVHADWVGKKMEAERRAKAHDSACAMALKTSFSAALPEPPPPAPEEPVLQRLTTTDATIEKLADMMATSPGLTLVRDELSGFLKNMSRYNTGSDRQFYLECYSGGTYAVDRVGRAAQQVRDLYLNILGGIQPDVARELFSGSDTSNDGFLDRFGLIAFPDPPRVWRNVDLEPDADAKRNYNDVCDRLFNADWRQELRGAGEGYDQETPYARFDGAAQDMFDEWLHDHMNTLYAMSDDPIQGMYAKGRGLVVRLVIVIHLSAWAGGEELVAGTVSEQSLTRALTLFENYLVPTWRRTMATFGRVVEAEGARRIARHILVRRLDAVRIADITKLDWAGLKDRRAVEAAFEVLVSHDWLAEPVRQQGMRGRPSSTYPVNPRVHDLFEVADV